MAEYSGQLINQQYGIDLGHSPAGIQRLSAQHTSPQQQQQLQHQQQVFFFSSLFFYAFCDSAICRSAHFFFKQIGSKIIFDIVIIWYSRVHLFLIILSLFTANNFSFWSNNKLNSSDATDPYSISQVNPWQNLFKEASRCIKFNQKWWML